MIAAGERSALQMRSGDTSTEVIHGETRRNIYRNADPGRLHVLLLYLLCFMPR